MQEVRGRRPQRAIYTARALTAKSTLEAIVISISSRVRHGPRMGLLINVVRVYKLHGVEVGALEAQRADVRHADAKLGLSKPPLGMQPWYTWSRSMDCSDMLISPLSLGQCVLFGSRCPGGQQDCGSAAMACSSVCRGPRGPRAPFR